VVNRRSYPSGQAPAALLKALMRMLTEEKGAAAADAWLRGVHLAREDLADETRMVPLAAQHRALVAFAALASREAIPRASRLLVAPDALGVWVRVLRGTNAPGEALGRLDTSDSQYGRTTRWESISASRNQWRGRVNVAHDPTLEQDGLLALGRLAELAAVPSLFGYPDAKARHLPADPKASGGGFAQEFEVEWVVPNATKHACVGAAAGLAVGALGWWAGAGSLVAGSVAPQVAVLFAGALGATGGMLRARDVLRRADAHAQRTRVHALERSLFVKESREREVGAQLEGSVVASQYRILRRMGSGATGVIYEAARLSDGVPVALKLLRAATAHEAVASDRLRREAEALGLAWHPNVVEVLDHGYLADGTSYLVMELLTGESLATRLQSKRKLSPQELLPFAMQVCDALAAVHAAGVVHRDLKPSNIYLAIDRADPSASERVKLLDFGIARVEWEETRITNTGGPLGTPGYMSPEQEIGSGEVDGRSDVFALGAVLFECLVGEPPPPMTPSGLIRTAEASAVRLDSGTHRANALVPPEWRSIIEKAMAVKPEDRYPDARAFAQALRRLGDAAAKAESR
jgi:serine/threonine-protein kinase